MELDRDVCLRALGARDARFDGRFFVAVRTTGIYCRPLCGARAPKPENGDVATLADRLGVGERHLRRLFDQHIGASPVAVAQTRRVLLAKKLVHETDLSM